MNKELVAKNTPTAVEVLPDSARYKCRFTVRSASSNRLYMISFDSASSNWTCSCPGNIRHGQCKHLTAAGLKGHKFGKSALTMVNEQGKLVWKS